MSRTMDAFYEEDRKRHKAGTSPGTSSGSEAQKKTYKRLKKRKRRSPASTKDSGDGRVRVWECKVRAGGGKDVWEVV